MLTPEQIAQRRGLVTSSVIAACTGLSERWSPLAGWCWVLGEAYIPLAQELTGAEVDGSTDMPEPTTENRYSRRGHDLERVTLAWGAEILGCDLEVPAPFVRHANGMFGDSCDALYVSKQTGEVYCAEAKTVSPREAEKWGQEMTADIAPDYRVQCHWHLVHHPVDRCYVPFLGGYDFGYRLYCVERNAAYEAELCERAEEFWRRHVATRTPPPVCHLDTDYLKRKWPLGDRGNPMEPTDELVEAAVTALKWRARLELAEKHHATALNVIRDIMGTHDEVAHEHFKISHRNNKDSEVIDWQALALTLGATPEQIHKFTGHRPGPRVLRVTGRGPYKKQKASKQ